MITATNNTTLVGDDLHFIIFDIKKIIQQVPGWTLIFSHREANQAVDALAKIACNLDKDVIWMEEYPPSVTTFIQNAKLCNPFIDE